MAKRILMTADPLGGVWVYSLELARAFAAHGIEVSLAVMGAPLSELQKAEAREISNLRIFEGPYRLEWMEEAWSDMEKAGKWLLELEALIRPDIIHLNNYAQAALPWQSPVLVVGHSCVCSWWEAVHKSPLPAKWARYRDMVRKALHSADFVVAPTRHMLENLEKYYGIKGDLRVIHNGRPPEEFLPGPKYPFIFSAGRLWDEGKNIEALDRAASGLPWPVYVAGPSVHPDGSFNGFKHIRKLGPMSSRSVAGWLRRANVYALPARYEPFGLSVLEAALSGCALVLGDIPGLREIWQECALFVPPDDSDALKEALQSLMSDQAKVTRMAAFARRRALEFTPRKMAEEYLTVYSVLLNRNKLPEPADLNELARPV